MKTNTWKLVLFCGVMMLCGVSISLAQNGIVSIYKVDGLISGTTVRAGENIRFVLRYNNSGAAGTTRACDISNGFKISSPDGAIFDSVRGWGLGTFVWREDSTNFPPTIDSIPTWSWFNPRFSVTYSIVPRIMPTHTSELPGVNIGLLAAGTPRMPNSFNDSTWSLTVFFHDKAAAGKHLCVDSGFFGEGGVWKWVSANLVDYFPEFQGLTPSQPYSSGLPDTRLGSGYCFELYAPLLTVSKTQLTFAAEVGGTNPQSQSFDVTSTGELLGDHLSFNLVEASSWLNKSPSSGTTPRTIQVSVNTAGLASGTYTDSIRVESAGAGNSPLYVRVILEITSPAPTIAVSKSSFSFIGLQGGSDPAAQTFIVKNIGGSSLLWSLTHLQPWLSLSPANGIDSTVVSVALSVVGLPTGEFYDTITVSDPAATNNPVLIPVRLSLGSSLPSIVVDSAVNHILRPSGSSLTFSHKVYVRNGGVGALTYSTTENSGRIQSIVPTSGAAPESVQVNFKIAGTSSYTYVDTMWVSSPEAANSPYPVVFLTRIVDTAATLNVSRDTIKILTYLCSQGPTSPMPQENFFVYNGGGDNPIIVSLLSESEFFTLPSTNQEATAYFTVQAAYPDVPAGVYYDTIIVTCEWAVNSPQKVIVRYERSAGTQWEIDLPLDSITIFKQEHTGPAGVRFKIVNKYPGCMTWSVDEDIPWFEPTKTNGNAPEWFTGLVDAESMVLGTYRDSMHLLATGAVNSPKKIILIANIWRFYGDCNWSGFVDVVDLSWLIAYLTEGQPLPRPELLVGDVTCNEFVDLSDLTTLVSYLTLQLGAYLCGNP